VCVTVTRTFTGSKVAVMTYVSECKPIDVPVGRRLHINSSTVDSSAALVCDAGFVPDTTVVTCTANGTWSPRPSPCGTMYLLFTPIAGLTRFIHHIYYELRHSLLLTERVSPFPIVKITICVYLMTLLSFLKKKLFVGMKWFVNSNSSLL